MPYCIIETEGGWTIAQMLADQSAEEVAGQVGGAVIDPGPYDSYEEASDALVSLEGELAEENGTSDVPGASVIEEREAD